ncbi:hypothetical protein PoB_001792300 [Plakobranchus ocellatus]|uniref:Uncharacterized protein n=1 Tax=Plakobranchus ocellatus TaxID=259542 RepID=A0AAV3ZAD3_9GAST|nr:hypothetical protein PoB_001792300 [Plakobranchus ocellatus]
MAKLTALLLVISMIYLMITIQAKPLEKVESVEKRNLLAGAAATATAVGTVALLPASIGLSMMYPFAMAAMGGKK